MVLNIKYGIYFEHCIIRTELVTKSHPQLLLHLLRTCNLQTAHFTIISLLFIAILSSLELRETISLEIFRQKFCNLVIFSTACYMSFTTAANILLRIRFFCNMTVSIWVNRLTNKTVPCPRESETSAEPLQTPQYSQASWLLSKHTSRFRYADGYLQHKL